MNKKNDPKNSNIEFTRFLILVVAVAVTGLTTVIASFSLAKLTRGAQSDWYLPSQKQGTFDFTNVTPSPTPTPINPTSPTFSVSPITVSTDRTSYSLGNVITIYGQVGDILLGTPVSLQITAPNGNIVAIDQTDVDAEHKFSKEITAEGGLWKSGGTYTVKVLYGTQARTSETSFSLISSPSSPTNPPPTPSNLDKDNDGIPDNLDSCMTSVENYNGYQDSDGCPDAVAAIVDWKTKALTIQSQANSKIESMKQGVYTAENSLSGAYFENPHAQKQLEKAWTELWWAKKYLNDAEVTQKEGHTFISKSNFKDGYYKLDYSLRTANRINEHLFQINDYSNVAHSLESQYRVEEVNNKTCFLFWCW